MSTEEKFETIVLEPIFGEAGDYLLSTQIHDPLGDLSLILVRYGDEDDSIEVTLTGVEFYYVSVQNFSMDYEFEINGKGRRPCVGRAMDSQMLRRLRAGPNFYGLERDRLQHLFVLGGEVLLDVILTGDVVVNSTK